MIILSTSRRARNLGLMKNDLKYGVAATAAVIHGRGRRRSVLVGDVDVHFDVLL